MTIVSKSGQENSTIVEKPTSKILLAGVIIMLVAVTMASAIVTPTIVMQPQNPVIGFSTVEVIDEHTGETIALYNIVDDGGT